MDYKVILADGTEVWLNAESRIEFPSNFQGNERRVSLQGEAYFKVARNEQSPFIVSTEQNGDEWIITAALRKNGKTYKDFIYIITQEDPGFEEGSQHKMYGTCIGNYRIQSEETNDGYPSVDLLFWDD